MFNGFTKETSEFLWELSFHNERPWFQEHKDQYLRVLHEPFHALAEDTRALMAENWPLSDFDLHVSRIYRDARRLFGRGPYKDHLWFTLKTGGSRHTEGPVFWFELSAATFSYGLGYFDLSPAEADAFRHSVDVNPARFERLASDLARRRGLRLGGPEYKRPKGDLGPAINPWYNRRYLFVESEHDVGGDALSAGLPKKLLSAYEKLMPMYAYLMEVHRGYGQSVEEKQ